MGTRTGTSISREGRELVERLGGRWTERGGMCLCPAHDDRTPSLSVRPGRTRLLFHCFAGCSASEILRALVDRGLLEARAAQARGFSLAGGDRRRCSAALRIWAQSRSLDGTPAAQYLAARGLRTESPQLRYHPRAPLGAAPFTEFRPALIAAVRDDTGLVAIHRTFIDPVRAQLAPLGQPRRGLGRFGSGAVRLGTAGTRLGLAEGIETALSASVMFGIPCWATLGAERFAYVRLPAGVEELLLFLDNDAGGRRAERLARAAFAVPRIHARYAPRAGSDWNDELRSAAKLDCSSGHE
ncbi:MAG: toprim domain-containing protein [Bacillota bacterium]